MANSQGTFDALLSEAPEVKNAHALTIIGVLARTGEKDEFAIVTPEGRSWAFKRAAYKSHRVLSQGAVGLTVVEVELEPNGVPEDVRKAIGSIAAATNQMSTVAEVPLAGLGFGHKAWGAWWDVGPGFGGASFTPASPFVLANPHVAPMSQFIHKTHKDYKARKDPPSDYFPKHPSLDQGDVL